MAFKTENHFFEHDAWQQQMMVCGIDEAGRGPLVGPVVVAAAVLPQGTSYDLLKDSKKLTEKQREKAFVWMQEHAFFTVVVVDHYTVDTCNVYQATKKAMIKAYLQMATLLKKVNALRYVVIDAMPLELPQAARHEQLEVHSFPFAESRSMSVAAASIVAKVTRDNLVRQLHDLFPCYNLKKHKGYGTREHDALIRTYGLSLIHRQSFVSKYLKIMKVDHEQQAALF